MADRRKKSWGTFKNEMKAKRRKTGDGGAKKNEKGNILERQELVVRLSSEVSGKAQKYTRVEPCEFVQYDDEELSTERIKAACEKHFSPSLECKGLSCDVLAGEQGPSCRFDPFKTSQDNPLRSNEGEKRLSQAALIPSVESSSSSYCTNSQGPTLVYFWALPDTSELSLTTNSCLSRMLPFSFFFAPPSPVLRLFAFISFLNVPQDFFLLSAMLTCHKVEPARHLGLWQF